jgi:TP901 family phage tail tape measure protein
MADDININLSINETLRKIQAGESGVPFQATLDTSGGQHTYKAVNSEIQKYLESQKATVISATQMVNLLTRGYKDYDSEIQDITKQLVSAQGETKKQLEQQLQEIQDLKKFSERKAPVGTEIHKLLELQEKGEIKLNRAVESAKYLLNKMNSDSKAFEELRTLVVQGDASKTQKNFERAFAQAQKMSQLKIKAGLTGGQAEKARAMTLVHDGKLYVVAGTTDWSKGSKIGDYKTTSQFHPESNIIQTAVNANLLRAEQGRKKMPVSGKIVNVPTTYTRTPGRNKSAVYDIEVGSYEQIENMMHKALDILEGKQTTQGVSLPGAITGSTLPQYHAASAYYGGRSLSQLQKEFTAGQLPANKLRGIIWKGIEKEKTGGTYGDLASRLFKGGGQFYTKEFVDAIYGEGASGGNKRTNQDALFIQSLKDARAEIERRQYAQMEPGALSEYDTRHDLDEFKEIFGEWGAKQQEYAKYQLEDSDEANIGFYLEKFGDDLFKTVHQKDPEVIAHLLSRTYAASDVYDAVYKDVLSEINQGRGDEGKKPLEIEDILSEQQRQEYILSKNLRQRFEDLQPLDKDQPFSYIEEFAKIAKGGVFPGQTESFSRLMSWMNRLVTSYPTMYDVQQQGMEDIFRQYGPGNGKLSAALRNPSLIGEIFEDKGYIGLTSTAKTPEEQLARLVEQEAKTKQELEDVWDKIKSDPDFGLGSEDSKVIDEADKIFTKLLQTQKAIESLKGKIEESKEAQSYEMLTSEQEATLQKMKQARAAAFQAFDQLPVAEEDLGEPTPLPEYLTHGSKAYKLDTVYEPALSDDTELQQAFEQLATSSQEESNQVVVDTVQKTEQSIKKQVKKMKDTPSDAGTTVGGGMTPVQVFGRSQADLKGYIQKQILTDENGNIIGKFYHSQQSKQYVDYGPYGDLQGWQSAFGGKTREEAETDLRNRFAARRTKESGELYANDEKTLQQILDKVFGENTKNNPLFEEVKGIHEDTSAIKSSLENLPEDWNSEGMRQLFAQISGGSMNANTFGGFAFGGSKPKKPSNPQQGTLSKDLNAYRKNTKLITDYQKEIESLEKTLATTPSMLGKGRDAIEQMILMRTQDKQALIEENELMLAQGKLTQQEADAIELAAKAQRAYNSEKVKAQKGGASNIFEVIGSNIKNTITRMFDYTGVYRVLNKLMASVSKVVQLSKELDSTMFNLRVVTGDSREETVGLIGDYRKLADQLGATTVQIANAANEWLRQGYEAQQANELITASTYLSKLGMIESGQATEYLTSMIKGFKLEVSDAIDVVSKLTAVDMEAASSAGDIAAALQNVSTTAQLAGVSLDETIAYATTIIETTQRDASSVGMALRTIMSRYGNVKAGAYTKMNLEYSSDTDLENLNDIEKVLGKIGIRIRSTNTEFRSFSDVLEELSDRWINLDNVSKNAIATAMAGVRQREQFLVLMENMDRVEELEQVSATSQGTAEQKYAAYMETIESASNRLQSAWENLAMTLEQSGLVKLFTDISVVLMKYFLPALQALGAAFVQYNAFKVPTLMKEFFSGKGKGLLSGLGSRKFAQYRQDWKASKLEELQKKSAEETTEAANNKLAQSATSTASALDKVTESASQGATAEVQATKEESKNTSATSRDTKEIKEHAQAVAQDTNKQKTGGVPGKEGGKIKDYFKASLSNAPGAILGGALSGFTTGVGTEGSTTAKAVSGVVAGGLTALGGAFAGPIGAMIGSTIGSFVAEPIANAIDKEENDRKKRIEDATKLLDTLKSQESALEAMTAMSKQESLLSNDIKAIRQYVQDIRDSNKEDSTGRRTFEELLNTEAAEAKQQGRESLIERLKAGTAQSVYDNLDLYLANDSTEEARELRKELTLFLKQANVRAQKNAFLGSKEGKTLSSSDKRELLQYEIQEAYLASGISNQGSSELAKKGIKAAYQEVVDAVNKNRAPEDQLLLTSDVQKMIHLLMEEDDSTSVQSLLAGGNYTLSDIVHNTYKLSEEVQNDLLTQAALALGISIDDVKKRVDEFGLLTVGDLNSSVSDLSDALSSLTSYFDELMSTGTLSLNSLNEIISANGDMATSLGEKDFSYLSSVIPQNFAEIGRKSLENWSQGSASGAGIYEKLAGSNDANIQAAFQILEQEGFTEDKSSLNNLYNALKSNKFGQGTEAAAGAEAIWDMYFENYLKASENIDNIVAAEYEKTTQSAQNAIDRSLQRQQNALEEQKSALEDINSQREYENKLIEAKIKLENAQNEKKKVWREGVGWVYEADTSAIADAQKELDELDNEKKVNELQVMIDELQAQRDWMSNLTESKEFEKAQEFMKQWANNADSTMAVLKFWENAVDNPPSFNTTDKEQLEANKLAATTYKDGLKLDSLNQAYTNLLNTQGGKLLLKGGTQAQLGQMDESDIKAFNTAVNDFQTAYKAAADQKALTNDDAVEFSGLTSEDIKKFNSMQKDTKSVGYITSGIGTVQNISKSDNWSTALTIEEGESDLERLIIVLSLMNGSTNYTMSGHEAGSLTPTTNEANENEDGIRWNTSWRKDLQVLNDDGTWFRPGDAQGESTANIKQKYSKHFLYNQATGKYYYIGANGIVYDAKFTPSHATGTLSAPGGISMVNDDPQYGLEGIITPQGTLTALPSKSGVVPADMTRNVWQLGEVAPNLVKQLVDINGKFNSPLGFGTDESFNVDHLDVHMVAQPGFDMDDFVRQLRAARDLSKHS